MKLETFVIGNLEKDFLTKRNEVMQSSKADLVMILNTDIEVKDFGQSLTLFEKDPKLFAVTFSPQTSKTGKVSETDYANGGSSIYNRKIWNQIGGIDLMFAPYWWDDIDYSVRAKKAGYHILEDGRIKVIQKSEMGTSILRRSLKSRLIERRNYVLFLLKNNPVMEKKLWWHPKIALFYFWAKRRFDQFYPQSD